MGCMSTAHVHGLNEIQWPQATDPLFVQALEGFGVF